METSIAGDRSSVRIEVKHVKCSSVFSASYDQNVLFSRKKTGTRLASPAAMAFWAWRWLLLLFTSTRSFNPTNNWDDVQFLDKLNTEQLKQLLSPLVAIAVSTYTYPNLAPIAQWKLSTRVQPLIPAVGPHSLVYEEDEEHGKLVLTFRGTSSEADACADIFLFGNDPPPKGMIFPDWNQCAARYSNSSLDYVSQAAEYARLVRKAYPDRPLLLTGHSLGAALAVAVSALLSKGTSAVVPVVAFCSPGGKTIFQQRKMDIEAEWSKQAFVLGDEWDAVMKSRWDDQIGNVCLFKHKPSTECAACTAGGTFEICTRCLFQAHDPRSTMVSLEQGLKPWCESFDVIHGRLDIHRPQEST